MTRGDDDALFVIATTLDTYRENYHFDFLHRDTLAGYAYGGVLTFDAFGRLPGARQRAFWSRETGGAGMAASMWGMFTRMPTRSRLELARATLGR